jgi:hypothetical protein
MGLAAVAAACNAPAQAPADEPVFDPAAPPAYPLRLAPGKRYPVDASGRPFFVHGDSAWSMPANLTREEADDYLSDRARRGFTVVQVKIIEKYHARRAPRNAYGAHPFGGELDFRTPNDAYFAHVDWIVRRAAELGLLIMPAPAWFGADGGQGGFYQELVAAGPDTVRAYGAWLGRRYASAHNIVWVMGGDYSPPEKQITRAMAEGIRAGGGTQLMTGHGTAWQSSLDTWEGERWLDLNAVYTYGSIAKTCEKAWHHPSGMPFFLFESTYEREGRNIAPYRIRQQAWEAVLSGGFGHAFGNNPIWYFSGPGPRGVLEDNWRRGLDMPGSLHMQVVRDVMRQRRWHLLQPDFGGSFVRNRGDGDDRPTGAVAADGAFALVYAPLATALTLDLARLRGRDVRGQWIDPTSGERTEVAALGRRVTTLPARLVNAAGAGDWVLLLEGVA